MVAPVRYEASGESKKAATAAISAGCSISRVGRNILLAAMIGASQQSRRGKAPVRIKRRADAGQTLQSCLIQSVSDRATAIGEGCGGASDVGRHRGGAHFRQPLLGARA